MQSFAQRLASTQYQLYLIQEQKEVICFMRMTVSSKRTWSIIMIVSLIFSMLGIPPSTADANSAPSQVTLVGTLQSELGHSADWDPRRRDNHERYGERRIQVYRRLARGIVRIQDCDRRQVGRELRLRPLFQSERSKQGWQHPHNARSRFPGYLLLQSWDSPDRGFYILRSDRGG